MSRAARTFLVLCVVVAVAAFGIRRWLQPAASLPSLGAGTFRIATWNTGWLLDATSEARFHNIRSVIESLDCDVLAIQEVESESAFKRALPPGYSVAIADDPKEDQELGVAIRAPFRFAGRAKVLFASRRYDYAFPGRRNVLEVPILAPDSTTIFLYVVHYKSRGGGRTESDPARRDASRHLLDYLRDNKRDRFLVLGDFNDTPSDESLNILETGDHNGSAIDTDGKFLVNFMQRYYERDFVTQGFFRRYRGNEVEPIVRGASEDNDRLRGTYYTFPAEVKVTEALFDQILVTPDLAESIKRNGIYYGRDALTGNSTRVSRNREGVAYIEKHGSLPSDHLPVYVDLTFGDSRPPIGAPK